MFELYLVACVAMRACEYVTVPHRYESEARCQQQGAVLAGMVRGRHPHAGDALTYTAACRPQQTALLSPMEAADGSLRR